MSDRTCTRAPCHNFAVDCEDFLNRLQEAHGILARFMAQAPDRNLCHLHPHQGGCTYCDAVRHFGKDPNQ